MKKFMIYKRLDVANIFIEALESRGYEQVKYGDDADFFLYDSESVGRRRELKADLLKRIPGFIYPHNSRAYLIWDGLYDPLPVQCNFVFGRAAVESMRAYGYPYRVEAIGFPYFKIRPFTSSQGTRLLFVPTRLYPHYELYRQANDAALAFILRYRESFEKVTICRVEGQYPELESGGNLDVITTHIRQSLCPLAEMMERIDRADIVISAVGTAIIAMAMGKGTIMYGRDIFNVKGRGVPKHIDLCRRWYFCPYQLEDMSIHAVLQCAHSRSDEMESWIDNQLGGNFDAEKFISVIGEYLR